MKTTLMGMKQDRHDLLFSFASKLASHFKGDGPLIEGHLEEVAGNDPKMKKKVKDCLKSLEQVRADIKVERWRGEPGVSLLSLRWRLLN